MLSLSKLTSSSLAALSKASPLASQPPSQTLFSQEVTSAQSLRRVSRDPVLWTSTFKDLYPESPHLSELPGITKIAARLKHMIEGCAFPRIKDGPIERTWIDGTSGKDVIYLRFEPATGGAYVTFVTRDADDVGHSETFYLNAEEAKFVQINGRGGGDTLVVDSKYPYPVVINGGEGSDLITGGAGDDIINGGGGHDVIWGNRGDDTVFDRDGNSEIHRGANEPDDHDIDW